MVALAKMTPNPAYRLLSSPSNKLTPCSYNQSLFFNFHSALIIHMKSFDMRTFFLLYFLNPNPAGILAANLKYWKSEGPLKLSCSIWSPATKRVGSRLQNN